MGKPGRRRSDLDDYLDWQQRLKDFKASGLGIDVFCLREGVSRSAFYRWTRQLKNGIPESMAAEARDREQVQSGAAGFVPISLTASPVEFELPNGGIIRLPLGFGLEALLKVAEVVGRLRPWRAPNS